MTVLHGDFGYGALDDTPNAGLIHALLNANCKTKSHAVSHASQMQEGGMTGLVTQIAETGHPNAPYAVCDILSHIRTKDFYQKLYDHSVETLEKIGVLNAAEFLESHMVQERADRCDIPAP